MKKNIIIASASLGVILLIAYFLLKPGANNNNISLPKQFVAFENNWAKIPQEFCQINADGSLTLPADYVEYDLKDSIDDIKRESYVGEDGKSMPYVYYKKEITNTRTILTPGSAQINIRSKDYSLQNGYIYVKPDIFTAEGRIVKFYETPAAKLQSLKPKSETPKYVWYILLGINVLVIAGYIYWRLTHEDVVELFKKQGVDMTFEELQKFLKPGYDVEELAYMIKIYHSRAKNLDLTYDTVVKNVHPEPIANLTKDLSEKDAKLIINMQKLERKRFEGLLDTLEKAKKEDPSIKPAELLKLYANKFDVTGTFNAHQRMSVGGTQIPLQLMWKLKNPTNFRFHIDNITKMGKTVELESHMHKYQNPAVLEELIKVYFDLLKADIELEFNELEKHYINGGHVDKLVNSIFLLRNAGMDEISYKELSHIDLAGIDLSEIVPKAIKPAMERLKYDELLTHDLKKLEVEVELTYRLDLKAYINTAGLATLKARVDEAMHSVIGSLDNHIEAIKNPSKITKTITKMALDEGTSLLIVSLNITKIKIVDDNPRKRYTGYHGSSHH